MAFLHRQAPLFGHKETFCMRTEALVSSAMPIIYNVTQQNTNNYNNTANMQTILILCHDEYKIQCTRIYGNTFYVCVCHWIVEHPP